jgi:hypothetical protein
MVVVVGVVVDVNVDVEVVVLEPFTSVVLCAVVVGLPVCVGFVVVGAPLAFADFVTWVVVECGAWGAFVAFVVLAFGAWLLAAGACVCAPPFGAALTGANERAMTVAITVAAVSTRMRVPPGSAAARGIPVTDLLTGPCKR